jgi:hypothetical protein
MPRMDIGQSDKEIEINELPGLEKKSNSKFPIIF